MCCSMVLCGAVVWCYLVLCAAVGHVLLCAAVVLCYVNVHDLFVFGKDIMVTHFLTFTSQSNHSRLCL